MNKKVMAFDFETIANSKIIDILPDIKPSDKLKSEKEYLLELTELNDEKEKFLRNGRSVKAIETKIFKCMNKCESAQSLIDTYIREKRHEQIKKMGLNPMLNMICCAGYYSDDHQGTFDLEEESEEAEKDLINKFWDMAAKHTHFVTFNGRIFDMKCLLIHGAKQKIFPSVNIDSGRYNKGNHTDLRQVFFGSDKFQKGKLDFVSRYYLGHGKTEGMTGDQVQDYWDIGLTEDISEYCLEDCSITHKLYRVAESGGMLE